MYYEVSTLDIVLVSKLPHAVHNIPLAHSLVTHMLHSLAAHIWLDQSNLEIGLKDRVACMSPNIL